jgi:hypothetical protein
MKMPFGMVEGLVDQLSAWSAGFRSSGELGTSTVSRETSIAVLAHEFALACFT